MPRPLGPTLLLLALVIAPAAAPAQPGPRSRPRPALVGAEVDSLLRRVLADWKVPGIAVGVIADGRVVLATGAGHRDLARKLPVTARTMFGIGSNTKSFTGLVLAQLAAEGRIAWNEPVRRYLPEFELADPVATRLATVTDLLTHMTGLPRHDGLWYGRSNTRAEILARLRHLEPSATFRSKWQYNNLMFLTAGLAAERVSGRTWDDLVRERILGPLGMTETRTDYRGQLAAGERAEPYELRDGAPEAVPLRDLDNVAPAGSIGSTVDDMLKYVAAFLDTGTVAGKPVLAAGPLRAIQVPQVMMGVDIAAPEPDFPELGFRVYGLGLAQTYYRGERMVLHGGGIDGYTSQMTWMPARRLGIVVLTNSTSPASEIVTYSLYDRLLGLPPIDWNGRLLKAGVGRGPAPAAAAAPESAGPARPLAEYAGDYRHPGYGQITILVEGDRLVLSWDRFRTGLERRRYDAFQSGIEAKRWGIIPNLASFPVTFLEDSAGRIDRMAIPFEPAVPPIVFRRLAER